MVCNPEFKRNFERCREEEDAAKTPSMAIIATKGTLDWAYPPFILGSTAVALGWEVTIFFSFYGLEEYLLMFYFACQKCF